MDLKSIDASPIDDQYLEHFESNVMGYSYRGLSAEDRTSLSERLRDEINIPQETLCYPDDGTPYATVFDISRLDDIEVANKHHDHLKYINHYHGVDGEFHYNLNIAFNTDEILR